MKIINQTADEMVLKDGSVASLVTGIIAIIIGGFVGYALYTGSGVSDIGRFGILVPIVIILIGIVILLVGATFIIDINKAGGQITYQKKHLIGARTATYTVADVVRVETRKTWRTVSSKGVSHQVLVSQSMIVLKDGQEVPLDHQKQSLGFSNILTGGQNKETMVANQVATFLGVPFQEIAPPSIPNIIEGIREGIAEGMEKGKTDTLQ